MSGYEAIIEEVRFRRRLAAGASRIRTPGPTCDGIDMKRRSRAILGGGHDGNGKFRTERLVARSWQIEDLPLAMELWGDPAVTRSLIPAANSPWPKSERGSAPRSSGRSPVVFSIGRCSITA